MGRTWAIVTPATFDALWRVSAGLERYMDPSVGIPNLLLPHVGAFLSSGTPIPGALLDGHTLDPELSAIMHRAAARLLAHRGAA